MSPKPTATASLRRALVSSEVRWRAALLGLSLPGNAATIIKVLLPPLITHSVALLSAAATHARIQRIPADPS